MIGMDTPMSPKSKMALRNNMATLQRYLRACILLPKYRNKVSRSGTLVVMGT